MALERAVKLMPDEPAGAPPARRCLRADRPHRGRRRRISPPCHAVAGERRVRRIDSERPICVLRRCPTRAFERSTRIRRASSQALATEYAQTGPAGSCGTGIPSVRPNSIRRSSKFTSPLPALRRRATMGRGGARSRSRAGVGAGEPGCDGAEDKDHGEKSSVNCGLRIVDCGLSG